MWFKKKRIYLDYAAATPVLPLVTEAMKPYWSKDFYNPNAIYLEGIAVKKVVYEARLKIARLLGVTPESIIFTSGGTEANTLAVRGVKLGQVEVGSEAHSSVIDSIRPTESKELTLVSGIAVDNKLGRQIREERKKNNSEYPLLHLDASQTAQYYNVGLERLACDLLTLDSAKLYGPKGIGALVVRSGVKLDLPPLGTPAVPLIVGFAKALEIACSKRESESKRLEALSEKFAKEIEAKLPELTVTKALPNIINVGSPKILPELLVLALDREGVMVSAGPACNSNKPEPPETLVRFSLGRFTTEKELTLALKALCQVVKNLLK